MVNVRIKRLRRKLGLSVNDLADLLGLARSGERTVRRWEDGTQEISGPAVLILELLENVPEVRRYLGIENGSQK